MNLGIIGASLATSIAPLISIIIASFHFKSSKNNLNIVMTKFQNKVFSKVIMIGMPSFLTELSTGFGIFIYNRALLKVSGNDAVIAYGIATNILIVSLSLFTGVAQGIQPIVSKYYAKKKFNYVKLSLKFGLVIYEILGIICILFAYIKTKSIITFFNASNDPIIITISIVGIKLLLISLIFSGPNVIFNIFFSAINNSRLSILIVILRGYVLPLIMVNFMSKIFGILGIWISLMIIELLSLILEFIAWKFIKKRIKHEMKYY